MYIAVAAIPTSLRSPGSPAELVRPETQENQLHSNNTNDDNNIDNDSNHSNNNDNSSTNNNKAASASDRVCEEQ